MCSHLCSHLIPPFCPHSRTQPCITSSPAMVAHASHPCSPEQLCTPIPRTLTGWFALHLPSYAVNTLFTPPVLAPQPRYARPAWPSHGPPCMKERDSAQYPADGPALPSAEATSCSGFNMSPARCSHSSVIMPTTLYKHTLEQPMRHTQCT